MWAFIDRSIDWLPQSPSPHPHPHRIPPPQITQVQAERLQGKKPSLLAEEGEEGEDFVFVQVCVWERAKQNKKKNTSFFGGGGLVWLVGLV